MSEPKDPAIKLFGKTIPVPEVPASYGDSPGAPPSSSAPVLEDGLDQELASSSNSSPEANTNGDGDEREVDKDSLGEKPTETTLEGGAQPDSSEEFINTDPTPGVGENPKTPSVEKGTATLKSSKSEEEQSEISNSQEKTLNKPDKILLCPRCNSLDTKFCYYNNYNVDQPRHFCKNCQRYWTAGGTMRNVPVGAGRRKNKNSASHYRHLTVSEALQNTRSDVPNGIHGHHPSLKSNGTVLTFGSDTPLCESMASVLSLAGKTMRNSTLNGFHKPEKLRVPVTYGGGENGDDTLGGSSVIAIDTKDEDCKTRSQEQVMQNCQGFPPQMPCYPGAPWPYPKDEECKTVSQEQATQNCQGFPPQMPCYPGAPWPYPWNSAQWSPPVPLPPFCPPGFPIPFYPAAAYWGCSVPGTWNIPWLPQPSSPNQTALCSGPNSPTLGKHSRDENTLQVNCFGEEEPPKENNAERCLWIPKTLRIDDPGEAARSSIWATLGIKNDKADSIGRGRLFKAFQSKSDDKNHVAETSPVLQANPAALFRSLNFQETS